MRARDVGALDGAGRAPAVVQRAVGSGDAARVLALQRAVGNRAFSRIVAGQRTQLMRCGCRAGGDCRCGTEQDPLVESKRRRGVPVLARTVSEAPRISLQRRPAFKPNRAVKPGSDNPPPDCTPFFGVGGRSPEAEAKWELYRNGAPSVLPGGAPAMLSARCHCPLVGDAYARYLDATGGLTTLADDKNCISEQCSQDEGAHQTTEAFVLKHWHDNKDLVAAALGGGQDAEIDLVPAAQIKGATAAPTTGPLTTLDVSTFVTYGKNTLAGALLFGGGSPPGAPPDSDFGRDTRTLTGTIKLHRLDDGSDPTVIEVDEIVTFKYQVHDALDFCPGNTLRQQPSKPGGKLTEDQEHYNQALSDFSRLEASGMSADVGFDVAYHRFHVERRKVPQTPAPVIELGPTDRGTVTGDFLRHRTGPGLGFPARGLVPRGTELTFDCFSHGTDVRGDDVWCHRPDTDTWVSHSFIADIGSTEIPDCANLEVFTP